MIEKKIILAVDDMPENLMLLGSLLEEYFDIRLAKSAKTALDLLKGIKVDLILLDIEMPDMSGFEFMKNLKEKDEKNRKTPVIFVTSHADSDLIEEAINSGAKDYILKPVKDDLLYKKIDAIIGMPKYKSNSLEGKLEQLLDAVKAGDSVHAKALITEINPLANAEVHKVRLFMEEISELITDFEYKKGIVKIENLLDYLSLYRK